MYVHIVTYNLSGVREEDYIDIAHQVAPQFSAIGGLHAKVWLRNSEKNSYGAVYFWEDRQAMERFEASELFEGTYQGFANVVSEGYEIYEHLTRATQPMLDILPGDGGWAAPPPPPPARAAEPDVVTVVREPLDEEPLDEPLDEDLVEEESLAVREERLAVDEEPMVDEEALVDDEEFLDEPEPEPVVRLTRRVVKRVPKKVAKKAPAARVAKVGKASKATKAARGARGAKVVKVAKGARKVAPSRKAAATRVTKGTRVTKKVVRPRKAAAKKAKRVR